MGLNCQGWQKVQQDQVVSRLGITRKDYISQNRFYAELHDLMEIKDTFKLVELVDSEKEKEEEVDEVLSPRNKLQSKRDYLAAMGTSLTQFH
jgi:hypothetical protein